MPEFKINLTGPEIQKALDRGYDLERLADGSIPLKRGTDIEPSALSEDADRVTSSKDVEVPPDTIWIGEGTGLSGAVRAVSVKSQITGNTALVLTQLFDNTGFKNAFVYSGGASEDVPLNTPDGTEHANSASFDRTTTADEIVTGLTIKTTQINQNLSVSFVIKSGSSAGVVAFKLSETKQTNQSGIIFLDLRTDHNPILIDSGEKIHIDVSCADMTGKTIDGVFIPNLVFKRIVVERKDVALKEEIPSGQSVAWTDVVHASEVDVSGEQIDASKIKNIPSGGAMTGTEIINAIINDPAEPKLPAADVADLTGTEYRESDQAVLFDPINKTYIEVQYEHTGGVSQTMPNLVNSRDGLRLMIRNTKTDDSTITLLPANSGQTIDGKSSYTIDPGVSVLFIAMTGRNSWHVETEFEHQQGPVTAGVTLDNATDDIAGVTKINVPTSTLIAKGGGEVDLIPHITLRNTPQGQADNLAKEIHLLPPLKTYPDPNAQEVGIIAIAHDAYEPLHKPSFLAYLDEDEELVGRIANGEKGHHEGKLWFGDVVWPSGAFIEINRTNKTYGIQEADTLDPNVSGGTDYLIAFRIHMRGKAPESGHVRAYLYNASVDPFEPTGYLQDKNGQYMGVDRHYASGEDLGVIEVVGVVNAKGLQEFSCHVLSSFDADTVTLSDRANGGTGLMIQALTTDSKTGVGLAQFELDTAQHFEFSSRWYGADFVTMRWLLQAIGAVATYTAGTHAISSDGWRIINPNGLKSGVEDGHLVIKDDGTHICDFNFGKVFSAEETQALLGKDIEVTATLVDKDDAYRIGLVSWDGIPDEYTPEIFTTRNNDAIILQANWSLISSVFISEDAVSGDHTISHTFTMPDESSNCALIIYPVVAQLPSTLNLKQFKADVSPAFTGYAVEGIQDRNQAHLIDSTEYKQFSQTAQGYQSLRYTINNAPTPMPVGMPTKGKSDITIDSTINPVPGSAAKGGEGALVFGADGDIKLSSTYNVYAGENVPDGVKRNVRFWWSTVGSGNVLTPIQGAEVTVQVTGGNKVPALVTIPAFDMRVYKGDKIAASAQADIADGAFVEAVAGGRPVVTNDIQFNEITPALMDDTSRRLIQSEVREVQFSGITAQNYTFEFKLPAGVVVAEHSVVKKVGDKLISVDTSEFSYDPDKEELTVHVGTATDGYIYLTLWSE